MKLFWKAFLLTLTTGLCQTILPAKAEPPWVYTTGGKLYSKTTECVREGRQIARASGFVVDEVVYDDDPIKGATVFGSIMSRRVAFTFRCETAYGIYSYATSAQDNDTAYKFYKRILKNDPTQI